MFVSVKAGKTHNELTSRTLREADAHCHALVAHYTMAAAAGSAINGYCFATATTCFCSLTITFMP